MKNGAVSVIQRVDGATSVFLVGKSEKKPLKYRVRDFFYKWKRKRMGKKIKAGAHTLREVISYADEKFTVTEVSSEDNKYREQRKDLKESLILNHKPELLGDMGELIRPTVWNEESIREFQLQLRMRSERIANIPDGKLPMDFHIYEIQVEDGCMEIGIDYVWDVWGISYSGNRKAMKKLKKVEQELYNFYGVTEEDIKLNSQRYSSLLTALCS